MKTAITQPTTEVNTDEFDKCIAVLYPNHIKNNIDHFRSEKLIQIATILFDSTLDKMKFPIEINISDETGLNEEKFKVQRKEFNVKKYIYALNGGVDTNSSRNKENCIDKITFIIASLTKELYKTLICIDFNTKELNFDEIKMIYEKYYDITGDDNDGKVYLDQLITEYDENLGNIHRDIIDTKENNVIYEAGFVLNSDVLGVHVNSYSNISSVWNNMHLE
ncbi:uncharacterized protein VNE69_12064 [Vairimorpha necatrix]|uniref:Uncharacterized protein n=1 Tax=Vairimorpha necatrix TaxID=6039 RepID=A0AAX4JGH2_9MICR